MKNLPLFAVLVSLPLLLGGCGEEPVAEVKSVEASRTPGTYIYGLMKELFQKYKLNAEKGDANAQVNLGWHYENGEGVPRDYVAAYAWLDIAQINADEDALEHETSKQWKDNLAKKMTSEQITKAIEISKEMVKKNPKLIQKKGDFFSSKYPNLKYEIKGDAVTITGCNEKASGNFIIPTTIENKPVTSIKDYAFSVTGLISITVADSVTSIGINAFSSCGNLTNIKVGEGNLIYTDIDGVLFNKEKTKLIAYPAGKTGKYTIPDSVTIIESYSFNRCTSLASVTIPESVISMGESAFRRCSSLVSMKVPNGITSIGSYTFSHCRSLTSITIPDSVTSIGKTAFWHCSSLVSIKIPDSVISIGVSAFSECTSLTHITIPDSVTSIGKSAFRGSTSLTAVTFLGDAPEVGRDVYSPRTYIYRKPEAKGWGDTFGGRPVKLISEKP